MSGFLGAEVPPELLIGREAFLAKPFTRREFMAALRAALPSG